MSVKLIGIYWYTLKSIWELLRLLGNTPENASVEFDDKTAVSILHTTHFPPHDPRSSMDSRNQALYQHQRRTQTTRDNHTALSVRYDLAFLLFVNKQCCYVDMNFVLLVDFIFLGLGNCSFSRFYQWFLNKLIL